MIKLIALIKRRPELSAELFAREYETSHAQLFARSIPPEVAEAIRYYRQNHAVDLGGRSGREPPYDCVTEFGFDDLDALRRWTSWYLSEAGRPLREDEERFMDTAQRVVIVTEEHEIPHR